MSEEIEPKRENPEEADPILRMLEKAAENIRKFGENLEKIEEGVKYFVAETIPRFLDTILQKIREFGATLQGYFQPLLKRIWGILCSLWKDVITLPFVWPFLVFILVGVIFKIWLLIEIGAACLGGIFFVGFILMRKDK